MIRFPEDRTGCIFTVRKEDYGQFVEDFFSSPETADYFIYPSCDTAEKTLTGRIREEQLFGSSETMNFLFGKMNEISARWFVLSWMETVSEYSYYGDPILYDPKPVFSDDFLFGGDG